MLSNFPFIIALIGFLVSYRLSVSFTRKVQEDAIASEVMDHPNERSTHETPIPRVGGLAIVATFYLGVFITWGLNGFKIEEGILANTCHPVVMIGAGIMCLVGLYDDRSGMTPGWKFFWQFLVAIGTVAAGVSFDVGYLGHMGFPWVPKVFTVFWIVGIINALNLIDGLDGLAAGVAGIASTFLIGAQMINGGVPHLFSGMVFLGALIGFLVYNWHPASIFMGDSGSLFLGYFLAVFALPLNVDADNYYLILVPICALGLPIFDTLSAFARRVFSGRSPFSADKDHLHHRIHTINRTKSGHYRRTIYSLYIISVAFGSFALAISVGKVSWFAGIVVALLIFVAILLYRYDYLSLAGSVKRFVLRRPGRRKSGGEGSSIEDRSIRQGQNPPLLQEKKSSINNSTDVEIAKQSQSSNYKGKSGTSNSSRTGNSVSQDTDSSNKDEGEGAA